MTRDGYRSRIKTYDTVGNVEDNTAG